jgi:hypothetical protein
VNGSQSRFLKGTWPISQNQPNAPLFYLNQDRIAIDKLSALETGLGTAAETLINARKNMCEIDDKNQLKNSLYPHRHFTEHLVGAFRNSPWESDLNHESSSLSIW